MIVLIRELENDVYLIERTTTAKVGVVVDLDLKKRGAAFHLEIRPETTPAWYRYGEQICQKLAVVMTGTSLIVVVVAESEMNESGKWVAVVVDEARYDAVTSEVMHCRACLAVLRVSFSSDIYHKRYQALVVLVPISRRIYHPYTAQVAHSVCRFFVLAYFEPGMAEIA